MAGPWDDYAPPAKAAGPWDDYAATATEQPSTSEDMVKSLGIGVPKGVMGLVALPGEASNLIGRGVNALGNWLTGKNMTAEEFAAKRAAALGGADIAAPTGETVRKGVESVTGPLYEPKTKAGEYAQTVGEFLPAAMAGPGGIARRAVTGAVIPGVASEAAGQATKGTAAEPYARMVGAVAPGALAAGAKGMLVTRRGGPTRAAEVANLEAEGVRDLTAGQRTGSRPLEYLEQSLGDVTGAGTRMVERGQEQFTRAVLRRAGEDAPRATPEVIDRAFRRIGDRFDDLAANNTLHPDRAMGPQIRQSIDEYNGIVSPPNRAPVIANFEQEIAQVLGANRNTIPGSAYQSLRSRMERVARNAPPEVADTVRGMKNALDQAMERHLQRTNSPDLGAWQQARREYRNILPIERAATAAGTDAATGLISPSSLRNAVVNQSRRGYARGTGDLARLARSGEAVMKQLPQSGTAPRAYMMSLPASVGAIAGGMASGNPLLLGGGVLGALGPPIGGRALMSRPVQNWLARQGPRNFTPALGGAASLFDMVPGRQHGGPVEEDRPYLVGEAGPEVFVPDDPWARAAARTGHRGRQEGAGTRFVEGGYGIPAAYRALDRSAQDAFESAGKIQHYGNEYYDPAPVVQQAIGAAGAPLVTPAMEGAVLGAGAIRRAAIPKVAKAELQAAEAAPYPQYAEQYPPTAPPVLKTDPKSGKEYLGKVASPEAEEFMKTREGVIADMKQGYEPYYDPAKRTSVDPSNYPGRNVDTLTLQPAMQKTIDKYMEDIGAPITRERLRAAYKNGQDLGNADNWYFMGQLEKDFVKELGPVEGRKAFLDRFASGMAATTSGNNPTTNLLMSHYLNFLEQRGLPMPTAGHQLPSPVGGRYGMSNVEDYMRMREAGGYAGLGENQPKMHNFARSFIGDLDRAVMDDQIAKGMLGHAADPKLPDRARKQAFGLLEQPLHAEAAAAGVRPGAYQDVAWAGFKNEPGKPMISHINDAIERTARLTGMSREEVVRRGLIRNEIPLYGFSAPIPSVNSE